MNAETLAAATALAATTAWLCRPLVKPRGRYRADAEIAERTHRLGRQRRLTWLALALTLAALVAFLRTPIEVNPDLRDLRLAAASCGHRESPYDPPTCYALAPGGIWVVEDLLPDGTRHVVATVTRPAFNTP